MNSIGVKDENQKNESHAIYRIELLLLLYVATSVQEGIMHEKLIVKSLSVSAERLFLCQRKSMLQKLMN